MYAIMASATPDVLHATDLAMTNAYLVSAVGTLKIIPALAKRTGTALTVLIMDEGAQLFAICVQDLIPGIA